MLVSDELRWLAPVFIVLFTMLVYNVMSSSRTGLKRVGTGPGFLSLGIWPARIKWILNGHELVKEKYKQVSLNGSDQSMVHPKILISG